MGLASDDDEFEGDEIAIVPISGTRVPDPVLAWARHYLAQQALAGGGEIHGAFHLNYGDVTWTAIPHQIADNNYKVIFVESGGCVNLRPFIYASRWAAADDIPVGYVPVWDPDAMTTSIEVEILNDTVPTDKIKRWGRPTWVKGTYDNMDYVFGTFTPGPPLFPFSYRFHQAAPEERFFWFPRFNTLMGNFVQLEWMRSGHWRPSASIFTGQMRHMVQCLYSQRVTGTPPDIPLKGLSGELEIGTHGYNMVAYGIVEHPFLRVIGGDAEGEKTQARLRRFYLIEISQHGLYYTKLKITEPWKPCSWATSVPKLLKTNFMWELYTDGTNRWKRIFTDTDMEAVYNEGCIPHPHANWAFSYSGHQASVIVTRQVPIGDDNAPVITRFSIDFTVNPPDPPTQPVHYLTAVINEVEQQTLSLANTGAIFRWPAALLASFPAGTAGDFHSAPLPGEDFDMMIDKYDDHGLVFVQASSAVFFAMPYCRDDGGLVSFTHSVGTFDIPVHLWYWGDDLVVVRRFAVADVNGVSVIGGPFSYTSGTMDDIDEPSLYDVAMPWYDREAVVLCGRVAPLGVDKFTRLFLRGEEFSVATLTPASLPHDGFNRLQGGSLSMFAMGGALFYNDPTMDPSAQQENALVMPIAQPRGVGSGYTNPTHSGAVDLPHTIFKESLEGRGILAGIAWDDFDTPLTFVGRI